jgi:hypothetical protein
MKPLSTQLQIKNAKAGVYSVTGASGFGSPTYSPPMGERRRCRNT